MITKEALYDLYFNKNKSYQEITKILLCSSSLISRYFKRYGFKVRKRIPWNKGLDISDPRIAKFCSAGVLATKGKKSWNSGLTKETDNRVAIGVKKLSKIRKVIFKGKNNPFYGKKHSDKFKSKQSLNHGGTGIPYEFAEYPIEFSNELKESVRRRDNYTCQECGKTEESTLLEFNQKLHVHHIDYCKENCNSDNLISLCLNCHAKTNNNNKQFWIERYTLQKAML